MIKEKTHLIIKNLSAVDLLFLTFNIFLTSLTAIYIDRVHYWYYILPLNLLAFIAVISISYRASHSGNNFWSYLHTWYMVPGIFLTFKELYYLIKPIRIVDFDYLLIQADKIIFGTEPTMWLHRISFPALTELLQISYATFFFLPIILAIELLIKERDKALDFFTFVIVLGFILSYIGYIILPAVGPRFTIHNFSTINTELPGLFLTDTLREMVNSGESIPAGTVNPLALVQRDVFPSGHTQMTLLVMYLSYKFKLKSRWFFLVNGSLLVFSTVYLRYHYGVDVIGGIVFMFLTLIISIPLYNFWMDYTGKERFEYGKY